MSRADLRSVSPSQKPRRLSLDDGTVAWSAVFFRHQLIFPTHTDSPTQRAFTDSAGQKPMLLFSLSLHAQILSLLKLCWPRNRAQNAAHSWGENATICWCSTLKEAVPTIFLLVCLFCFCSCKETWFHITFTEKSTVFQTSMFVLFLCFLKNLPPGPYCLLQRRGGVEN